MNHYIAIDKQRNVFDIRSNTPPPDFGFIFVTRTDSANRETLYETQAKLDTVFGVSTRIVYTAKAPSHLEVEDTL